NEAEVEDLRAWWLGQMLRTPVPLREVMTLFWHGHFTSANGSAYASQALYQQNDTLRRHALGSFRQLLGAIPLAPALLPDRDLESSDAPANLGTDDWLDWVVQQEATGRFLAGKLIDFFGAVDPRGNLQERLADVFRDSDYAMRPVLQA